MHEPELWLTKIFNDHLASLGNSVLGLAGLHSERPWADYIVMQILVAAIIVLVFALLRPRLSASKPGKFQHIFELIYDFV
jgi:F0F1-type ATP synthase membrane subunit a